MATFRALGIAAFLLLSGCAGSPVGDALRGPEKLAAEDDAYCRSIGAAGPDYTNCRLQMTARRDHKHERALDALSGRGPAIQCSTVGAAGASVTRCN